MSVELINDCVFLVIQRTKSEAKLHFKVYEGDAQMTGNYIKEHVNKHLYMNGFCWSSLLKYYFPNKKLLGLFRIEPDKEECVFSIESPNNYSEYRINQLVHQLADELIGFVPLKEDICKQLIDNDFEEWDDW